MYRAQSYILYILPDLNLTGFWSQPWAISASIDPANPVVPRSCASLMILQQSFNWTQCKQRGSKCWKLTQEWLSSVLFRLSYFPMFSIHVARLLHLPDIMTHHKDISDQSGAHPLRYPASVHQMYLIIESIVL